MRRHIATLGLFAFLAAAPMASAIPLTFASWSVSDSPVNGNGQVLVWNNQGCGANCSTLTASAQVDFDYKESVIENEPLGFPFGTIAATMSLSAFSVVDAVVGPALPPFIPEATVYQGAISGSMEFRRITDNALLLRVVFSNLVLNGQDNGDGASGSATTPPLTDITYSSDLLSFPGGSKRSFALSLTSVDPSFNVAPNGQLASFLASGAGTFSSEPAPSGVPEPASVGLMGLGLLGAAGLGRRFSRT
ncbi:MAG TPA: PEP-CTERM sorting domain-containing protein [Bryobacteraceae bacterium]|nr:PEP-CTERM sorting domain-containing protein [Bryobacteraceae bacterium]